MPVEGITPEFEANSHRQSSRVTGSGDWVACKELAKPSCSRSHRPIERTGGQSPPCSQSAPRVAGGVAQTIGSPNLPWSSLQLVARIGAGEGANQRHAGLRLRFSGRRRQSTLHRRGDAPSGLHRLMVWMTLGDGGTDRALELLHGPGNGLGRVGGAAVHDDDRFAARSRETCRVGALSNGRVPCLLHSTESTKPAASQGRASCVRHASCARSPSVQRQQGQRTPLTAETVVCLSPSTTGPRSVRTCALPHSLNEACVAATDAGGTEAS